MRRTLALALGLALLLCGTAGAQTVGTPLVFSSGPSIPKLAAGWTFNAPIVVPDWSGSWTTPPGPPSISFAGQPGIGIARLGSNSITFVTDAVDANLGRYWMKVNAGSLIFGMGTLNFTGGPVDDPVDLTLKRDGPGILKQEVSNNAQAQRLSAGYGGYLETGTLSEEITLATGATTTDSSANLLPANSLILGISTRVTTAITTCANFSVGDATTAARFISGSTGVALNSTAVGTIQMQGNISTAATGPTQTSAAKIRITCNVNPGAGKVRVQVFYLALSPPTT